MVVEQENTAPTATDDDDATEHSQPSQGSAEQSTYRARPRTRRASFRDMKAPVKDEKKKEEGSWLLTAVLVALTVLIFLSFPLPVSSHGGHEHPSEPASFKYSREANEELYGKKPDGHDHHHHHHHHHHDHDHQHHEHLEEGEQPYWRPEWLFLEHDGDVFVQAMGSTLLISLAPFIILFLVPLDNSKKREPLLKVLLAFATGGLLGDAFLHLIPHAVEHDHHEHHDGEHEGHGHAHGGHGHEHKHDMSLGLCILGGIITFLFVDIIVRLAKGDHNHHHHHDRQEGPSENKKQIEDKKGNGKKKSDGKDKTESKEKKGSKQCREQKSDIKVAGYLNLAADFLHNFTDGLAIGASYLSGNSVGVVTTFTILLHEVPHEIGDFAILIQSGCSKRKAIALQLVTAVGALLGTYISLLVGGMGDLAAKYIMPYTAGGFIYIATVSVIPELLNDTTFWQSIKQIIAMLVGVYMMVLVAKYE